jgi:hypothetical protein
MPGHMRTVDMKKGIVDIRWVATPTRQRLVTSRKRTLRSRSERAARSVWSRYESRVVESRKFTQRPGLPDCAREDCIALTATTMGSAAGPGSESGADVRVDIPGTCEGLPLPDEERRNGMIPDEQRPGSRAAFPPSAAAKQRKESGYRRPSRRRGRRDGEIAGRLSRPIVALESRETSTGGSL